MPEPLGPLRRGDLGVALPADQHHLVAHLDRVVADVDHQLVHRDRPGDRPAPAAHARPRRPRRPGCAAHRRRNRSAPWRPARPRASGSRRPYESRAPAGSVFTCETRAFSDSAGRSRPDPASAGAGRDAVDGDPGPHQVEAGLGEREQPGRVGRVHHGGRRPAASRPASTAAKRGQLLSRVRVVGLVGDREMGADAAEVELGAVLHPAARAPPPPPASTPTRCMPVSTLRWTGSGARSRCSTTAFASASMPSLV